MRRKRPYQPVHILREILPCLLVTLCGLPLTGQISRIMIPELFSQDSARAAELLVEAQYHYERDSLAETLELANEALDYAMRAGTRSTEVGVLTLIGSVYGITGQPGDAIPYYLRAADILDRSGDTISLPAMYERIARCYHSERVYEKEGEHYANALHHTPGSETERQAFLVEKIGLATLNSGDPDSAIIHFQHLGVLMEQIGRDDSPVVNYLAHAHSSAGRHEDVLEYNGILFGRSRERLDYLEMSTLKNNMGYALTLLKDYGNAVMAYQEAFDYGGQAGLPDKDLALLRTNFGICYQNMNQGRQAKSSFRRAIRDLEGAGEWSEKSRVENIMAMIYFREGDLYNAGQFCRAAIESARKAHDRKILSDAYLTYSRVLREGNDPIQALEYYENHLSIRDSLELESRLREETLTHRKEELERSERDLILKLKEERVNELAIQQLELELEREEQEKVLVQRESEMHELEQERLVQDLAIIRQQREVDLLEQQQRELQAETALALEAERRRQLEQEREIRELEHEQDLDRAEIERQKVARKALTWISILGVIITILILGSLVWTRKKNTLLAKQKNEIEEKNKDLEQKNEEIISQRDEIEAQRDLLSEQKEEIEHNAKEIMKSLQYASKIQTSTLPDLGSLNTMISDHFLFFRPRDIVSGDFFWTAIIEDVTVITVADCTGHGVPGAFMSMLGMSILKEIVQKEYITHPAVILRRMRKEVINALGQKGLPGEQRDGMDMSLITLHHATRKLEFAGAYNPLYLIRRRDLPAPGGLDMKITEPRNEDNTFILYEILADKMPISYFLKMEKFRSQDLELAGEDSLYLFSDGYPDQFGGPRGKKFKYAPFKQMLLENAHLPMPEQQKILGETLDSWQDGQAQVDDICVIGLKI